MEPEATKLCCLSAIFFFGITWTLRMILWPISDFLDGTTSRELEYRLYATRMPQDEIEPTYKNTQRSTGCFYFILGSCLLAGIAYGTDLLGLAAIAWGGLIGGLIVVKLGMMGMAKIRPSEPKGEL